MAILSSAHVGLSGFLDYFRNISGRLGAQRCLNISLAASVVLLETSRPGLARVRGIRVILTGSTNTGGTFVRCVLRPPTVAFSRMIRPARLSLGACLLSFII